MVLRFLVNNIFSGWMPDDGRLGGTEESIVEWADILSSKYKVQVFSNFMSEVPFNYRNATYLPRRQYLEEVGKQRGTTINIKSYDIEPVEPSVYLTNETDATRHDLSGFGSVIFPSQWAVDNIAVNTPTKVVPHGYNPDTIYPSTKVPKQCLYSSSPDRGLETLAQIWPSVVNTHPDATLIVTYGGQIQGPNVYCVGEPDGRIMDELYNTSEFWLHPCSGGELFGISAVKAQAAGAIPVYFPTMALAETVQVGEQCSDPRDMYTKLVALFDDEDRKQAYREELAKLRLPTWEISAALLDNAILETTWNS